MAKIFYSDFSGGLNLSPPGDLLQENECLRADNMTFVEEGSVGSGGNRSAVNSVAYNGGANIHSLTVNPTRNLIGAGTAVFAGALASATQLALTTQASATASPGTLAGTNWTTPANAASSDDSYAIYNNTTQDELTLTNFGFSLPASSTIRGFEILIEGNGTDAVAANRQFRVGLTKDGAALAGTRKTDITLNQTTDTTLTQGTSTDTWGTTWTQAEVEASTFGVLLSDNDTTGAALNIDHVRVRVYYRSSVNLSNSSSEIISSVHYLDKIPFEVEGTPYYVTSSGNAEVIANTAPATAPVAALGAAGVLSGSYAYKVTFADADNKETAGSDASNTISPSSQQVDLTGIPTSADSKHTKRFIYRTGGSLPVYYQVAEIADNTTTTYTDNITDTAVLTTGILLISDNDSIVAHSSNVKYPEVFFDRLFWVDQDNPNRVIWSKPLNPFAYPLANFIDFPSSNIYRVVRFLDELIIFADDTIYKLLGNSEENFRVEKSLAPIGTRWPFTINRLRDRLVLFNDGGFFFFDGLTTRPMTNRLDSFFNGITKFSNAPFNTTVSVAQRFQSSVLGDTYYLGYAESGQSENNKILVVDLEKGRISVVAYGALSMASDPESQVVYMGGTDGFIYQLESGDDNNGGSVSFAFQTKFFDPAPGFNKHFQAIVLDADTDGLSITPSVQFNNGEDSETLSQVSLAGRQSKVLGLFSARARKARNISIVINGTLSRSMQSDNATPSVRVFKVGLMYEPLKQRLGIA